MPSTEVGRIFQIKRNQIDRSESNLNKNTCQMRAWIESTNSPQIFNDSSAVKQFIKNIYPINSVNLQSEKGHLKV